MNREREQQQRLVELLGLMVQGLTNGRLHLVPGWDSSLQFKGQHLSRVILDLRFGAPTAGAPAVLTQGPGDGSSGAACPLAYAIANVVGVDVQAEGLVVFAGGDAGQPGVTFSQHPHPPVGTPGGEAPRGNSTPSRAPVAGHADWLNPVVGG